MGTSLSPLMAACIHSHMKDLHEGFANWVEARYSCDGDCIVHAHFIRYINVPLRMACKTTVQLAVLKAQLQVLTVCSLNKVLNMTKVSRSY